MKKAIIVVIAILTILGCSEEESVEVIYDFIVSPFGENSVKVDWIENETGNIVKFTIDTDNQFNTPVVETETESSKNTITLSGLAPVTNYFLKIEVIKNGGIIWSEVKEFTSSYTMKVVNYPSTDDVEICAIIKYVSTKLSPSSKKVIFMHEAFLSSKSLWNKTGIVDTLIRDGHLCVAFDFRGHGSSSYSEDITWELIRNESWVFKEDFDATINYLDSIDLDCSDDIIVFGASLGASVATAVSSYDNVIGGVAASAIESISRNMMGITPKGMYYIAGELDKNSGYDYGLDANSLFNGTLEPRQVEIIPGSTAHGVILFEVHEFLIPKAIDWVRKL